MGYERGAGHAVRSRCRRRSSPVRRRLTTADPLVAALAAKVAAESDPLTRLHALMALRAPGDGLRARRDQHRDDGRRGALRPARASARTRRTSSSRRRAGSDIPRATSRATCTRRARATMRSRATPGRRPTSRRSAGWASIPRTASRRRSATSAPASGSITPTRRRCAASGAALRATACGCACTSRRSPCNERRPVLGARPCAKPIRRFRSRTGADGGRRHAQGAGPRHR